MKQTFWREPIDKICFILIAILTTIIIILIGGRKICYQNQCLFNNNPKIVEFSWQGQKVGANDRAFFINFNRPIDHESVEENLDCIKYDYLTALKGEYQTFLKKNASSFELSKMKIVKEYNYINFASSIFK